MLTVKTLITNLDNKLANLYMHCYYFDSYARGKVNMLLQMWTESHTGIILFRP